MSLSGPEVDQIGNCVVSVEFFLGFPTGILLKPSAVIVFVEEKDPAGNQIHLGDSFQLLSLLLPLRQGFIGSQVVDVLQHLLLLLGSQILQDPSYFLAEEEGVLLFVIVEYA